MNTPDLRFSIKIRGIYKSSSEILRLFINLLRPLTTSGFPAHLHLQEGLQIFLCQLSEHFYGGPIFRELRVEASERFCFPRKAERL